jgi:hypothetical protein
MSYIMYNLGTRDCHTVKPNPVRVRGSKHGVNPPARRQASPAEPVN